MKREPIFTSTPSSHNNKTTAKLPNVFYFINRPATRISTSAKIKPITPPMAIFLSFFSGTSCTIGTSLNTLMVSGGHCTSTSIVSKLRLISTTTPFFTTWIVSTSLIKMVSRISTLRLIMVVSILRTVSRASAGFFAIARFRCHDAPQLVSINAILTRLNFHKSRIPRGFLNCSSAAPCFLILL